MQKPKNQMMKPVFRILALFLSLTLAAPHSVLALREQPIREKKPAVLAGLEEALLAGNAEPLLPVAGAVLMPAPPPASPVSVPVVRRFVEPSAAGAEEKEWLIDEIADGLRAMYGGWLQIIIQDPLARSCIQSPSQFPI